MKLVHLGSVVADVDDELADYLLENCPNEWHKPRSQRASKTKAPAEPVDPASDPQE